MIVPQQPCLPCLCKQSLIGTQAWPFAPFHSSTAFTLPRQHPVVMAETAWYIEPNVHVSSPFADPTDWLVSSTAVK